MSDSLEPPAKRARLDGDADASMYGASLDAPGSPVDDMDDDFYDTTPVKPAAQPMVEESAASMYAATAAASGPASLHLPGLGPSTTQNGAKDDAQSPSEGSEDGEVSDSEAFYAEQSEVAPTAAGQAQAQAQGASAQHDELSQPSLHTVSTNPAHVAVPEAGQVETAADGDAMALEDSDGDDLALAIANGLAEEDGKAEFLQAAEANKNNKDAEWQLDSDASESGSSSDSSSDSDSDEEGSDDGELLDPEEQVRLLMAESLDEPGATKAKVKTLNEVEEQYEKPDITVTAETKITELGKVESVVDNIVVVKGTISGDLQVLESGSALCTQDRTVIGKISEQIGRVEEPRYSLGFNDAAEITTLGIAKDSPIYYVDDHSTFVFTEPLRAQKHTDASNLHDEETNEVDFSDDEKEAEYKREQKAKKRARQDEDQDPAPVAKKIPTGPKGHVDVPNYYQPMEYQGGGLKYSDDEDEDLGMYKPLARPDHFEQIVGHGAPLEDRSHVRRGMMRGRGQWGDRGRGFRGRGGFGGRGDFGGAQADRGGHGAGRGDRGGHSGRGDQGNRGGAQGGRTDRTCYACGQVGHQKRECPTLKPQLDRGRQQNQGGQQQDNRQNNGPYQDQRSATSASPNRNQRGQSQQSSQPQHSPPAKSKNKNRKQRAREKKEKEREQQQQQAQQQQQQQQQAAQQQQSQQHASPAPNGPAAPANTNAYANNSAAGWPQQYSHSPQPAAAYAPPAPPAAIASYPPQMPYAQAPAPAPAPAQAAAPAQQQANWAAWAQWIQVVQTMQQQQQQAVAPPPQPPQPRPQAQPPPPQYPYQYQQYAQPPQPPANPHPQADAQSAQSLQDILRALGGGGQR